MRRLTHSVLTGALSLGLGATLLSGCATPAEEEDTTAPRIEAISKRQVVVGESLFFYGNNLPGPGEGETRLHFQGRFLADNGNEEQVDIRITPLTDGETEEGLRMLRWNRFGPFGNPFSPEDRPGIFEGTVVAETEWYDDGRVELDTAPRTMAIEVGPSLIVEDFQPIDAECSAPALRALPGLPYRLQVKAVGIQPVRFQYSLSQVNGRSEIVRFENTYNAPVSQDAIGDPCVPVEDLDGMVERPADCDAVPVIFNPVPPTEQFYVALIRIVAFDADGNSVETAIPMTVHRPVEVQFESSKLELAELYEPIPVSGCIPGSLRSTVRYSETVTETRQQSVGVTINRTFNASQGVTNSESWHEGISDGESTSRSLGTNETEAEAVSESQGVQYGRSENNNVGYSSTDGESWSWNTREGETTEEYRDRTARGYVEGSVEQSVGVEGEGSVPGFAKVSGSVQTTVGVTAGAELGTGWGARQGTTRERGFGASGSRDETTSFGSATTDSVSKTASGTYALSRSRTRSQQDTTARQRSRTWSMEGGVSEDQTVSEGMSEAESRTWVNSSSSSTTQGYSGFIPNGRFGIFYRQTARWTRRAEVRAFDLCGVARHMGELQFNEWTWAPDLAIGDSCDSQPPPSELPKASCLIEPCDG